MRTDSTDLNKNDLNKNDLHKKAQDNKDAQRSPSMNSGEKQFPSSDWHSVTHESVQTTERWVTLCAQAAIEQDPKKLLELVSEINRLLDHRRKRLLNTPD